MDEAQRSSEDARDRLRRVERALRLVVGSLASMLVVLLAWTYLPGMVESFTSRSEAVQAEAPAHAPAPRPAPSPATRPDAPAVLLVLEFEEASWLEVRVDGLVAEPGTVIPAGGSRSYSAKERVAVRLGNAGGVRVVLNGEDLGRAGANNQVVGLMYGSDGPID